MIKIKEKCVNYYANFYNNKKKTSIYGSGKAIMIM